MALFYSFAICDRIYIDGRKVYLIQVSNGKSTVWGFHDRAKFIRRIRGQSFQPKLRIYAEIDIFCSGSPRIARPARKLFLNLLL